MKTHEQIIEYLSHRIGYLEGTIDAFKPDVADTDQVDRINACADEMSILSAFLNWYKNDEPPERAM